MKALFLSDVHAGVEVICRGDTVFIGELTGHIRDGAVEVTANGRTIDVRREDISLTGNGLAALERRAAERIEAINA